MALPSRQGGLGIPQYPEMSPERASSVYGRVPFDAGAQQMFVQHQHPPATMGAGGPHVPARDSRDDEHSSRELYDFFDDTSGGAPAPSGREPYRGTGGGNSTGWR